MLDNLSITFSQRPGSSSRNFILRNRPAAVGPTRYMEQERSKRGQARCIRWVLPDINLSRGGLRPQGSCRMLQIKAHPERHAQSRWIEDSEMTIKGFSA
jgi:hypothetical protein